VELRPIAIGETIRRLVSKCCFEATSEDAKIFFGPLQVGVSTQGGAEAAVHAARRLAKEFENDPGKIMLKVDFSNAFNVVDRTEMIQVYDKFPRLSRWVEYCYSHPVHLFFGTITLQSMGGVQKGDPFGPLLFSLVLHPLALQIRGEFPHLDLGVWYLDDGTIIGDVEDVFKVFQCIESEGPAGGLVLNVKKNEIWWPVSCGRRQSEKCRCDRKLPKSLGVCEREGIHFVPLAWESTGGATHTVHEIIRKWTEMESARSGYLACLIRRNLYFQISVSLQRSLAQAVIDRRGVQL